MMSPMQRTLAWLREHGYQAAKTEHFNWKAKVRQDLFGFIDVLAVSDDELLAIQVSDGAHHAEHVAKIMALPVARQLVFHMNVELWSWSKRGARGKRKLWTLRRDALTARLLPKHSLLREKIESGTWDSLLEDAGLGDLPDTKEEAIQRLKDYKAGKRATP